MATITEHIQAYSEEEQKAGQKHILKVQLFLKKKKKTQASLTLQLRRIVRKRM